MRKGKGAGPSFHTRRRSSLVAGRAVVTRLTRTMGFVELSELPGTSGSIGACGDDDPEAPDPALTAH